MTDPIEPPAAGGPVEDWPVGQFAEVDCEFGSGVTVVLRDDDGLVEWWEVDGPLIVAQHEVTAVRPLRLVPDEPEQKIGGELAAIQQALVSCGAWSLPSAVNEAVRKALDAVDRIARGSSFDQSTLRMLAGWRARVLAIPAGSYRRDLGFDAAINRVLEVLGEEGAVACPNECIDGRVECWSPGGPCPVPNETGCETCGPCAHCAAVDGPESVAAPSVGTGTPAEEVSGGSNETGRQEPVEPTFARERLRNLARSSGVYGEGPEMVDEFEAAIRCDADAEVARYRAAVEKLRPIALRFGLEYNADDPGALAKDICDHFAAALGDGE